MVTCDSITANQRGNMKNLFSLLCSLCVFLGISSTAESKEMENPSSLISIDKGTSGAKQSRFDKWVPRMVKDLSAKAFVVNTALGPIEYIWHGEGPAVVSIHGGFGGYEQAKLIGDHFSDGGFSVLSVSRPGYLGTPLSSSVEFTPAQQADLIAALIDQLEIKEVVVLGFSAGAPVAFELAKRHSGKVTALILESIGKQPHDTFHSAHLEKILTHPVLPDYFSYLTYMSTHTDFYSAATLALSLDTSLTGSDLDKRLRHVLSNGTQYQFLKKMIVASMPISPRLAGIQNDFLGVDYWESPSFDPTGFKTPTVIVQAIDDHNGDFALAQSLNALISGSQVISVEDSGHFIWLGPNTKKWEHQVDEFLKGHIPEGFFKPDRA